MGRKTITREDFQRLCREPHALNISDDADRRRVEGALEDVRRAYALQGQTDGERRFQKVARQAAVELVYELDFR
jgi:hypothetical protein